MGKSPENQYIIAKGIVERDGKFLMVQRDREEDDKTHGVWEFPGGKVDFGEKPGETACREIKEETGFKTREPEPIAYIHNHVWNYEDTKDQVVLIPYKCHLIGGSKDSSDKDIMKVSWLKKSLIEDLECNPGTKELLKAI